MTLIIRSYPLLSVAKIGFHGNLLFFELKLRMNYAIGLLFWLDRESAASGGLPQSVTTKAKAERGRGNGKGRAG